MLGIINVNPVNEKYRLNSDFLLSYNPDFRAAVKNHTNFRMIDLIESLSKISNRALDKAAGPVEELCHVFFSTQIGRRQLRMQQLQHVQQRLVRKTLKIYMS